MGHLIFPNTSDHACLIRLGPPNVPPAHMDAHHRKIDLQSPSDLTYLLNNIKTAARQKIDLAIPASAAPEGEDAYRSKVDELVLEVKSSPALPSCSFYPSPFPLTTNL